LFRDSFKWYTLISLSFSILIPFAVYKIYKLLSGKFTKNKIFNFGNAFLIIVSVYLLFLISPAILGDLSGTFKSRSLPSEYSELNEYLSQDNNFYRTLWIPNTNLFGYYSNTHPQISGRDFFKQYTHEKLLKTLSQHSTKELINDASVKYVIVPKDTEGEIYLTDRKLDAKKYDFIVGELDKIPWLNREKEFGEIVVYKTEENKDHFWCDCGAQISSEFINPTKYLVNIKNAKEGDVIVFSEQFDFSWKAIGDNFEISSQLYEKRFNSFVLPAGNYELEVFYTSQKLIDKAMIISLVTVIFIIAVLLICLIKIKWR